MSAWPALQEASSFRSIQSLLRSEPHLLHPPCTSPILLQALCQLLLFPPRTEEILQHLGAFLFAHA